MRAGLPDSVPTHRPGARELARAIEQDQLVLAFQPKIALGTGTTVGTEVLVRWNHPDRGLVPPGQFIPLAEESGLIDPLTRWVVRAALGQWRRWEEAGLRLPIAVNVSAASLGRMELPDEFERLCREADVPAAFVVVELTETATQSVITLLDTLTRLRLKDFGLSIDDFGTGYSSLVQLQQLPFGEMKIDRSFVGDVLTSQDSQVICRTIIDLGHNLGLTVVAEGVESAAAQDLLTRMGCDAAQGYHIARPMEGAAVPGWIAARGG